MSVIIAKIKDHEDYSVRSDGTVIGKNGNILKPLNINGYCRVDLYDNKKHHLKFIHRLVAEAFIPNPDNLPVVNHKDENPKNNDVSNLEWCTTAYNNAYGTKGKRTSLSQTNRKDCSKAVVQFTLDNHYVATYPSAKEASRQTNISRSHICHVCNHYKNYYTIGGYKWAWESEVLKNGSFDLSCLNR